MSVQVGIVIRKKSIGVIFCLVKDVSSVFKTYVFFLLNSLPDKLDRVSSPDLSFLDDSAGRDHAVGSNDTPFLQDGSFHDD